MIDTAGAAHLARLVMDARDKRLIAEAAIEAAIEAQHALERALQEHKAAASIRVDAARSRLRVV